MMNLFSAIPIRDPYKVAHPESVVLLAKPSTIRICVAIEAIVVVAVFVLSFYYTQYDGTTETKITFETLKSPYECSILAPRKDIEELSPQSSELVAFSSPRFNFDECILALGDTGLDVCAPDNHKDFVLSLTGVISNDDKCEDLFLSDGYRFCNGKEETDQIDDEYSNSFLTREDSQYIPLYSTSTYYYVNGSGDISPISAEFSSLVSEFVVGKDNDIYVIATDDKNVPGVYRLQQGSATADLIITLALPANQLYGLAYGLNCVFLFSINAASKMGSVVKYNTTTATKTEYNSVINCTSVFQPNMDQGGSGARYISYGADGNLYFMCTRSTTNNIKLGPSVKQRFPFYQVNPVTLATKTTFYAPIADLDDVSSSSSLTSVSQVLMRGSKIFFLASSPQSSLIVGSLQQQSLGELQNLAAVGPYFGEFMVVYDSDRIFFDGQGSNRQVYSISNDAFSYEDKNFLGEYYYPTRIELGFMYQICDGNITDYRLDASLSNSFYKLCGSTNGIYYQSNSHFSVPSSCQAAANSPAEVGTLLSCTDMSNLYNQYMASVCADSFSKVCDAEYTDNPPFSCSKTVYPTWITCLATAFANASGVLAITFIIIKVSLRQIQYHYVHEFEYDRKKERYHDLNLGRIHSSLDDYVAGLEEGRMVVSDKEAFRQRKKNRAILENDGKKSEEQSFVGLDADRSSANEAGEQVDVISYAQSYDNVHSHQTY